MTSNSTFSSRRDELGRRWHTTSFRLLLIYAGIFSVSLMLLLAFAGWAVTGEMERQTDMVMEWQLRYFRSIPADELATAIHQRLEREHMHTNYYALFDSNGRRIAGDVLAFPAGVPVGASGVTLSHTLAVEAGRKSPVVRAMAQRLSSGNVLLVAQDLTHILRIRDAIINALIGGGLLCLLTGCMVGLVLSMRQMRRVKAIRRVTLQIAKGDLSQRLPIGGRDEIDMLSHLVNHMLDEVERLMNEVKGACDGIAHDLRTPLAHIRSRLSHIAERAREVGDESLSEMLESARAETDMLLERFRAMLRISEIGTLQRRGGFAQVQLETLMQDVAELYEPLAEGKSIRIVLDVQPVAAIHGDRALLFEMLSNLMDNAIKFSPPNSTVCAKLVSTASGPRIEIIDNGPGIPPGEREAVLQRFYRGEKTRHLAGSGLGLSIVSAVIRMHDFAMKIDDAKPGTRVTVDCWSKTLA